jgi:AcrR family transcriptional regulator
MAKRGVSRARMLDTAADLLHRQGYASTGLNQILEESGAPKGSLYFHFPGGKEELFAEALEQASRGLTEMLERVLAAAPSAQHALDMIIAYFSDQLERSKFTKGCPIATVALEQAATSDALQCVCSATYTHWLSLITARLIQDGLSPDRADALAHIVLSSIEGALLLSRAHRSTSALARVGAELKRLLPTNPPKKG